MVGWMIPACYPQKEVSGYTQEDNKIDPTNTIIIAPTRSFTHTATITIIKTSTIKITPSGTLIPVSNPVPSNTPTPTALPDEYYITDIEGHHQYFKLGCEAAAAVDWAAFYGIQINEFEFQYRLPISDNPDIGFVGNVDDPWGQVPPYSYGVHAKPIADLLRQYGLPALGKKDLTIDQLKDQIANHHPVIAWVIGNCVGGIPYQYQDKEGNYVTVAAYEHVIIITGYNSDAIRYLNNGIFYDIPMKVFENSWKVLGNMAVVMDLEDPMLAALEKK